ncbi:MAG: HAMP domain-containing sensor histidine kinase [Trueperaceae bacterium]|jgi:histidine kinase|nr:HAMP domain-containing sensor histidine kinase [Truepera sp.]HRQ11290.1 HAMP domain-containing sensor histidine kinase [Trueperaceae bacterium]
MTRAPKSSLYWRLLPAYLLVIVVGAGTTFLAGEALAPFFLQRHVDDMMGTLQAGGTQSFDVMAADLEAGFRRALTRSLLWALLASAVAAGVVGLYVTRRLVRPLRALTHASRRIAGGQYSQRLGGGAPGEIGELAAAFNVMAETLERSEERRVQLMADVAHEFRTPLSNLRGYLEGLEDGVFKPEELAAPARRQVQRLERLADDLSLLSRVETGQVLLNFAQADASALLVTVADAFRPRAETKGLELEVRAMPNVSVWADAERTDQVLTNLVANALRFTPSGGRITLAVTALPDGHARFEVSDTGAGIPPDQLGMVFNRFFRGDQARAQQEGGGSGIGLTLAKQFVERQGGEIGVSSRVGQGSSFWFTLPMEPGPR